MNKLEKPSLKEDLLYWIIGASTGAVCGFILGYSLCLRWTPSPLYLEKFEDTMTAKFDPLQWGMFIEYTKIRRAVQDHFFNTVVSKKSPMFKQIPYSYHGVLPMGVVDCTWYADGIECEYDPFFKQCFGDMECQFSERRGVLIDKRHIKRQEMAEELER